MGAKSEKTKIVNNSVNPVWNETFVFEIDSPGHPDPATTTLQLLLWVHQWGRRGSG